MQHLSLEELARAEPGLPRDRPAQPAVLRARRGPAQPAGAPRARRSRTPSASSGTCGSIVSIPTTPRSRSTRPAADEGVAWTDEAATDGARRRRRLPRTSSSSSARPRGTPPASRRSRRSTPPRDLRTGWDLLDHGLLPGPLGACDPCRAGLPGGDGRRRRRSRAPRARWRHGSARSSRRSARRARTCIAKGLVYAPEHGLIAFTVPGMAHFIARSGRDERRCDAQSAVAGDERSERRPLASERTTARRVSRLAVSERISQKASSPTLAKNCG